MGHSLDMRPLAILLTLIAGEQLFGVVGMIIAIPVMSLLRVLLPHLVRHYQHFRTRERGIWSPGASIETRGHRSREHLET
jgi:predicted PurR-regulated permease PerM